MAPQPSEHLTPEQIHAQVEQFFGWAGDALPARMAFKAEHGQWYALATDFDITSKGDTLREAIDELMELVIAYLFAHYRDGEPLEAAKRPVPVGLRVKIRLGTLVARARHAIDHQPPRGGVGNVTAPSAAIERLVAC